MKRTILILGILAFCRLCQAQYTKPEVLTTSGDFFTNSNASLSWTMGEAVTATLSGTEVILTQGFQQPARKARVTGKLIYNNTLNSPMSSTKVFLKTFSGLKVDSSITNSSGDFYLYNASAGTYVFDAKITKTPGGFNSIDALQDLRHFVVLITLTGMSFKAGDVNATGSINSVDALLIAKRFVELIPTFSPGDWMITKDTITLGTTGIVNHDLKSLCYGDVNGSYVPGAKTSAALFLSVDGQTELRNRQTIILPFFTKTKIEAGSFSLIIHYPHDFVQVENIETKADNANLVYHVSGDEIRIAWFTTNNVVFSVNEPIFTISLKGKNTFPVTCDDLAFTTVGESFLSDNLGRIYPHVELFYPCLKISMEPGKYYLSDIYPNPVDYRSVCNFDYYLPEDAGVRLQIYNPLGEIIQNGEMTIETAGRHTRVINVSNLPAGIYILCFEAKGIQTSSKQTRRLVVVR